MDIILSTRNVSKAHQIQTFFADTDIHIKTLEEMHIEGEVVEDGTTLEENAFKKAWFAYENSGRHMWTMAEDTGLFITALDGKPGIYAARWAGEHATREEVMNHCLKELEGITDRSAIFRTVAVVISPDGEKHTFSGEVHGHLLEAPNAPLQPNMPYSALYVPDGQEQSWAQMTTEHENEISHRGQALRKVKEFLEHAMHS